MGFIDRNNPPIQPDPAKPKSRPDPADIPCMARRNRHNMRPGFTMVELMIVVAILGIIGVIAIPMFRGTHTTRLRSAAQVLAADLDATRAESIAHGEDLRYLVVDNDNKTWFIAADSDTTTPIDHIDTGRPYTRTLGVSDLKQLEGVTISSYSLDTASETGDNKLGFGLYGQLDQTTNATITLESQGSTVTLTINAETGEVSIGEIN